jgi:archaeal flagellar protein FlaJ
VLSVIGLAAAVIDYQGTRVHGIRVASAGLFAMAIALQMAHPIQSLRALAAKHSGGASYDRRTHWTQLKVRSILLNFLMIMAFVVLAGAVGIRLGWLDVNIRLESVLRLAITLSLVLAAVAHTTLRTALRIPLERTKTGLSNACHHLVWTLTLAFTGIAFVLSFVRLEISSGTLQLRQLDDPFFLLAGFTALSLNLFLSRGIPTIYALFSEEREFYKGKTYATQKKSVIMPTMIAFALLFLVLLVVVVFQLGLTGLVEEVPRNALLLLVFAFIIIALAVSVIVAINLSKSDDKTPLFQHKRTAESRREITILATSGGLTFILLLVSALLFLGYGEGALGIPEHRWLDFFCFGILAAIGPYGFYAHSKHKRIRKLEERFPDFIRDLAASRRAGLTMEAAVQIASRGEYGALTPEVQKMADQLSWNIPFNEALQQFADRVNTPLIRRAVTLINEASRSGGHVTDVLEAAALDAREIKNLENERGTTMILYTIIVYITFAVFLLVVAVLYGTFIPEILKSSQAALAGGASGVGGISFQQEMGLRDYWVFYFMAGVMQGLGNGIVAGLMETGKPVSGLRHSFIMVAVTYATFAVALG